MKKLILLAVTTCLGNSVLANDQQLKVKVRVEGTSYARNQDALNNKDIMRDFGFPIIFRPLKRHETPDLPGIMIVPEVYQKHLKHRHVDYISTARGYISIRYKQAILDNLKYGIKVVLEPTSGITKNINFNGSNIFINTNYGKIAFGYPLDAANKMRITADSITAATGSSKVWENVIKIKPKEMFLELERKYQDSFHEGREEGMKQTYFQLQRFPFDEHRKFGSKSLLNFPEHEARIAYYTPKFTNGLLQGWKLGMSYTHKTPFPGGYKNGFNNYVREAFNWYYLPHMTHAVSVALSHEHKFNNNLSTKIATTLQRAKVVPNFQADRYITIDASIPSFTISSNDRSYVLIKPFKAYDVGAILSYKNLQLSASYGSLGRSFNTCYDANTQIPTEMFEQPRSLNELNRAFLIDSIKNMPSDPVLKNKNFENTEDTDDNKTTTENNDTQNKMLHEITSDQYSRAIEDQYFFQIAKAKSSNNKGSFFNHIEHNTTDWDIAMFTQLSMYLEGPYKIYFSGLRIQDEDKMYDKYMNLVKSYKSKEELEKLYKAHKIISSVNIKQSETQDPWKIDPVKAEKKDVNDIRDIAFSQRKKSDVSDHSCVMTSSKTSNTEFEKAKQEQSKLDAQKYKEYKETEFTVDNNLNYDDNFYQKSALNYRKEYQKKLDALAHTDLYSHKKYKQLDELDFENDLHHKSALNYRKEYQKKLDALENNKKLNLDIVKEEMVFDAKNVDMLPKSSLLNDNSVSVEEASSVSNLNNEELNLDLMNRLDNNINSNLLNNQEEEEEMVFDAKNVDMLPKSSLLNDNSVSVEEASSVSNNLRVSLLSDHAKKMELEKAEKRKNTPENIKRREELKREAEKREAEKRREAEQTAKFGEDTLVSETVERKPIPKITDDVRIVTNSYMSADPTSDSTNSQEEKKKAKIRLKALNKPYVKDNLPLLMIEAAEDVRVQKLVDERKEHNQRVLRKRAEKERKRIEESMNERQQEQEREETQAIQDLMVPIAQIPAIENDLDIRKFSELYNIALNGATFRGYSDIELDKLIGSYSTVPPSVRVNNMYKNYTHVTSKKYSLLDKKPKLASPSETIKLICAFDKIVFNAAMSEKNFRNNSKFNINKEFLDKWKKTSKDIGSQSGDRLIDSEYVYQNAYYAALQALEIQAQEDLDTIEQNAYYDSSEALETQKQEDLGVKERVDDNNLDEESKKASKKYIKKRLPNNYLREDDIRFMDQDVKDHEENIRNLNIYEKMDTTLGKMKTAYYFNGAVSYTFNNIKSSISFFKSKRAHGELRSVTFGTEYTKCKSFIPYMAITRYSAKTTPNIFGMVLGSKHSHTNKGIVSSIGTKLRF